MSNSNSFGDKSEYKYITHLKTTFSSFTTHIVISFAKEIDTVFYSSYFLCFRLFMPCQKIEH